MFIYVWLGKNPWALKVGKREFAKAADFMYLDILLTSKKGLKKIINQFFKAYFEINIRRCFWCNAKEFTKKIKVPIGGSPNLRGL